MSQLAKEAMEEEEIVKVKVEKGTETPVKVQQNRKRKWSMYELLPRLGIHVMLTRN